MDFALGIVRPPWIVGQRFEMQRSAAAEDPFLTVPSNDREAVTIAEHELKCPIARGVINRYSFEGRARHYA